VWLDRQPRAGCGLGGRELGIPVTVVVPAGNSPDKNAALTALGAAGSYGVVLGVQDTAGQRTFTKKTISVN